MIINVTVCRSDKWVKEQRVASGVNVLGEIKVAVDPCQLSAETRRLLIDYRGTFDDLRKVYFTDQYEPYHSSMHGSEEISIDSEAPTVEEIDTAIKAAFARIVDRGIRAAAAREERRLAVAAEQAARDEKAKQLAAARELLADELAKGATFKDQRNTLAYFLSQVPDDALRGTLKSLVRSGEESEVAALQSKIEDASPVQIFGDDDETE